MKKILFSLFIFSCFFITRNNAQTWAFHLNGNSTFPLGNDEKTSHPMLWISSKQNQDKVIVGGFGGGVSYRKNWKEGIDFKIQANFQRSRFYDRPTIFTDENGFPVGAFIGVNTNLNAALFGMPIFDLTSSGKILFGGGLGVRGIFWSRSNYGGAVIQGEPAELKLKNKSLSPITLIFPLEFIFDMGVIELGLRSEASLTRSSRLPNEKKERNLIVFLELGCRFGGERE